MVDAPVQTHVYDPVGNRTARTASFNTTPVETSLPGTQAFVFDSRDQIDGDSNPANANALYDPNGNAVTDEAGAATGDTYDVENHLIGRGANIQVRVIRRRLKNNC